MTLDLFLRVLVLYCGFFLVVIFAYITYRLLFCNQHTYRKFQEISGSFNEALRGCSSTFHYDIRDHRKAAGLAVDLKENKWCEQSTLSEETLDTILR